MIRALDRFYAKHPRIALCIAVLIAGICLGASQQADDTNAATSGRQVQSENFGGRVQNANFVRHPSSDLSIFTETTWPWVMF
jgi:hypothetical protein